MNVLAARLAEAVGVPAEVTGRSMGGLSQETWFVTLGGTRPAVLRLPTAGSGTRSIVTQRRGLQVAGATACRSHRCWPTTTVRRTRSGFPSC